jgi:hypothetical protein
MDIPMTKQRKRDVPADAAVTKEVRKFTLFFFSATYSGGSSF